MNCSKTAANTEIRTFNKSRKKRKRSKYKAKKSQRLVTTSVQKNVFLKQRRNRSAFLVHLNDSKIMSEWYWANYNKALAWRNKHKVSYWKAYALALQHENKYLLNVIQSLDPGKKLDVPHTFEDLEDEQEKPDNVIEAPSNDEVTDEVQFEMSDEMIKFFEQSFKHKMDLKKVKEAEKKTDSERFIKESQMTRLQREEEMKSLYGDGASMIVGMETAVQLSYERYCDIKSPKYWPNIPLRL